MVQSKRRRIVTTDSAFNETGMTTTDVSTIANPEDAPINGLPSHSTPSTRSSSRYRSLLFSSPEPHQKPDHLSTLTKSRLSHVYSSNETQFYQDCVDSANAVFSSCQKTIQEPNVSFNVIDPAESTCSIPASLVVTPDVSVTSSSSKISNTSPLNQKPFHTNQQQVLKDMCDRAIETVKCSQSLDPNIDSLSSTIIVTVLGRLPNLNLVCKDGTLANTLVVYAEIDSICGTLRTIRLRFLDCLAECLGSFLAPDDRITIDRYFLPLGSSLYSTPELQFGCHLTEIISPNREFLSRPDLVTIRVARLRCLDKNIQPYELCYAHSDTKVCCISIPSWSNQSTIPRPLRPIPGDARVWELALPYGTEKGPRYNYTFLSLALLDTDTNFFGCVVDVSKAPTVYRKPKLGYIATMNIDVVDPSIIASFRAAFLPNIAAKISVMLIASSPENLPLVATGDLIRIHRTRLSVGGGGGKKYPSTISTISTPIFIDAYFVAGITSAHLWRLDDFFTLQSELRSTNYNKNGDDTSTSLQQWGNVDTNDDVTNVLETPSYNSCGTNDLFPVSSYWQSMRPDKDQPHQQWIEETRHKLTQYDWFRLCSLSRWAADSLYYCRCFDNSYYCSLWRFQLTDIGTYADIVVKVEDIELNDHYADRLELFNSQDTFGESQSSSAPVTTHFNASINYLRSRNNNLNSNSDMFLPQPNLRIRVTDNTGMLVEEDMWILSNFSKLYATYLFSNLNKGDWIRVRNVAFGGVKRLGRPSSFLTADCDVTEFYLLDGYKAKITKVPKLAGEVRN